MRPRIAIIGANYLQLPLVKKARAMGVETICFAWEAGAVAKPHCDKFYPISIVEKEQILSVCAEEEINGVVSIASDVAVPTVAHVANQLGLIGNSLRSVRLCSNKFLMRDALAAAGLRCPAYRLVSSFENLAVVTARLNYPLIVKPVDRSGSLGVTSVSSAEELANALKIALGASFVGQAIVEEFIEGTEVSVESVSWKGKHYHICVTDKTTSGSPHFVELSHHQPSTLPNNVLGAIQYDVQAALDALQIRYGASHAEFIVSDENLYVTEIGARMGGDFIGSDLVQLSTGYDFVKGVIEVALGEFNPPEVNLKMCAGVYFYTLETPEVLELIENHDSHQEIVRAERTASGTRPLVSSSDRSGYAIYQSAERFTLQ